MTKTLKNKNFRAVIVIHKRPKSRECLYTALQDMTSPRGKVSFATRLQEDYHR